MRNIENEDMRFSAWSLAALAQDIDELRRLYKSQEFCRALPALIQESCDKGELSASAALIDILRYWGRKVQFVVPAMQALAAMHADEAIEYILEKYEKMKDRPLSYMAIQSALCLAEMGVPRFVAMLPEMHFCGARRERERALGVTIKTRGKAAIDDYIAILDGDIVKIKRQRKMIAFALSDEIEFIRYYFRKIHGVGDAYLCEIVRRSSGLNYASILKHDFGRNGVVSIEDVDVAVACKLLMRIGVNESLGYLAQVFHCSVSSAFAGEISDNTPWVDLTGDRWFDEEDEVDRRDEGAVRVYNSRPQQAAFRDAVFDLYGAACAVCGIDIPQLIEAAHIITKKSRGIDDPLNGIPLCCLHHKAFDSDLFAIHPETYAIATAKSGPTRFDLKIQYDSIRHLLNLPHKDVLSWRWSRWVKMLDGG